MKPVTKNLALALASACLSALPVHAAEMEIVDTGTEIAVVLVTGDIVEGDAARFEAVTRGLSAAAIVLDSPGGDLFEGLTIGESIRARGFGTGVAPDTRCASACALAWIAGSERFMDPSAFVGFHAAYVETDGELRESGLANAMVGAYLTRLGFGLDAIAFATEAAPEEMNWLTPEDAQRIGIPLRILSIDGTEVIVGDEPDRALTSGALPSGSWWIVTASATSPGELRQRFPGQRIVQSSNGYFASILGPYSREAARQILATDTGLPDDAYLSNGGRFTLLAE